MVPPTIFISGGVCVLQLCKEVYCRYQHVKRFRADCKKLAQFVQRIEGFIAETEQDADMTGPGWQAAFEALHESLLEVVEVFEDCARYGIVRSMINADEINLRLSSIAQRLSLALGLIPIQKAKVTEMRLVQMQALQEEIRTATFAAARAAEQQSADLKRLMDQSRVDASKTQEMLAQVLALLAADPTARTASAAAAAADPGSSGGAGGGCHPLPAPGALGADELPPVLTVSPAQLGAEVADLQAEMEVARKNKDVMEEQYLKQVIAAISAMETLVQEQAVAKAKAAAEDVPADLRCPITMQLLQDPVILVGSGQTYERAAIEEWLARGNTKDPITGVDLAATSVTPNIFARKMAQEWLEKHPEYQQAMAAAAAAEEAAAAELQRLHMQGTADNGAGCSSRGGGGKGAKGLAAAAGGSCNVAMAAAAAAITSKYKITVIEDEEPPLKPAKSLSLGRAATASQDLDDGDDGPLELNPKAAAVLAVLEQQAAAAKGAGLPSVFDFGGPSSAGGSDMDVQQQKHAAQQAYAASVAANVAAEGGLTAQVAIAMRRSAGTPPPQQQALSSVSLEQPSVRLDASAAASSSQQQRLGLSPPLPSVAPSKSTEAEALFEGFVPAGRGSRRGSTGGAAAAAAALRHHNQPAFDLNRLQATLGRASEALSPATGREALRAREIAAERRDRSQQQLRQQQYAAQLQQLQQLQIHQLQASGNPDAASLLMQQQQQWQQQYAAHLQEQAQQLQSAGNPEAAELLMQQTTQTDIGSGMWAGPIPSSPSSVIAAAVAAGDTGAGADPLTSQSASRVAAGAGPVPGSPYSGMPDGSSHGGYFGVQGPSSQGRTSMAAAAGAGGGIDAGSHTGFARASYDGSMAAAHANNQVPDGRMSYDAGRPPKSGYNPQQLQHQQSQLQHQQAATQAYVSTQTAGRSCPIPVHPTLSETSSVGGGSVAGSVGMLASTPSVGKQSAASRRSALTFGRWRKGKGDGESVDDAASVSSEGSSASKASMRSLAGTMKGVLKQMSYTVVYQDDKC